MTKTHLLGAVLPEFTEVLDSYGITETEISDEVKMCLGFLSRYLIREEEYGQIDAARQTQTVLFFNMMDAIPERQRVVLNDFLQFTVLSIGMVIGSIFVIQNIGWSRLFETPPGITDGTWMNPLAEGSGFGMIYVIFMVVLSNQLVGAVSPSDRFLLVRVWIPLPF